MNTLMVLYYLRPDSYSFLPNFPPVPNPAAPFVMPHTVLRRSVGGSCLLQISSRSAPPLSLPLFPFYPLLLLLRSLTLDFGIITTKLKRMALGLCLIYNTPNYLRLRFICTCTTNVSSLISGSHGFLSCSGLLIVSFFSTRASQ